MPAPSLLGDEARLRLLDDIYRRLLVGPDGDPAPQPPDDAPPASPDSDSDDE